MEMAAAALKLALPINQINCHHQEQRFDLSCSGSKNLLNLKVQIKRKCGFDLWAAQSQWTATTTTSVEEEEEEENRRNKPPAAVVSKVEEIQITHDRGFHKDMNFLPRPLSALTCPSSLDGRNVRVAYRGAPGSFSEDAALKMYPNCETVPCDKFETAFKAVELWLVDKAILPMENSVGGSIHRNYDLLLRHRLLHIVGEVQLAVNHCLLGLHGVKKDELKFVLSHPQALDQCDTTLNKLGVSRVSVEDTAGAAQLVAAESMRETGAIASARAAKIYGLNIIEERIQDDLNNVTRFLILAREPIIPRTDRPYKTSIVFSLEEGPGVLFKALGAFALRGIELSKIESRPQRNRPLRTVDDCDNGSAKCFEYLFFVDFEASMAEHRAQYALRCLQEYATYLRVLGCYPMDITTL